MISPRRTSDTGKARHLADCPLVLFIVYRTAPDALARGYEPWLRDIDNPFFNAIPGIWHYANWKVDGDADQALFSHFDFLGLERDGDLERVWFNPDLDAFRRGWVAKWGYGPSPKALHRYTYGARRVRADAAGEAGQAWLYGGIGQPPDHLGTVFEVTFSLSKHFAADADKRSDDWRVPAAQRNPLGCDWIGLASAPDGILEAAGTTRFAYPASCIAKPG